MMPRAVRRNRDGITGAAATTLPETRSSLSHANVYAGLATAGESRRCSDSRTGKCSNRGTVESTRIWRQPLARELGRRSRLFGSDEPHEPLQRARGWAGRPVGPTHSGRSSPLCPVTRGRRCGGVACTGSPSGLPAVLTRKGPLRATCPYDGTPLGHGKIYVAPPGSYLLVRRPVVRGVNGPNEKWRSAAAHPLFRSAGRPHRAGARGVRPAWRRRGQREVVMTCPARP
jgi:hypothetical protein